MATKRRAEKPKVEAKVTRKRRAVKEVAAKVEPAAIVPDPPVEVVATSSCECIAFSSHGGKPCPERVERPAVLCGGCSGGHAA